MPSAGTSSNATIRRALASRWAPLGCIALALLLAAPSLTAGLWLDDWLQLLIARGLHERLPGMPSGRLDLFAFAGHVPGGNRLAIEAGLFPWWADPEAKLAFFRPLSSLTHLVDAVAWPRSAVAMHAHSLVWFGLALWAVARVYRRFYGAPFVIGLATLLYAVDDAHGPALGWVANRNAMVALALALPVLELHDRWRRDGWRPGAVLAPALLALALLAGESALAVVAYLVAHALHLERGRLPARLLRLWPYLAVVLVWRLAYVHLGYGSVHSGIYFDPGHSPRAFVTALPARALFLAAGQLALPWADFAPLWPLIAPQALAVALLVAALAVAAVVALLWPAVRAPADRFFATGALVALVPVCSTDAADRLLWFVGVGAMALVARLLATAATTRWRRAGVRLLVGLHLVAAPLLLPIRARSMVTVGRPIERADRSLPDAAELGGRTIVLVDPPSDFFAGGYLAVRRAALDEPVPRFRWLATATYGVRVTRVDERTLDVTPGRGFLPTEMEHMLRDRPLPVGSVIRLSDVTIAIVAALPDGRPATARFHFARPLSDFYWARWAGHGYAPFTPPPLGASVTLPPVDFMAAARS